MLLASSSEEAVPDRFEEAKKRFLQALRDLKATRDSSATDSYEWACFQAQQAAGKAVRALLYALTPSAWGHSVVDLATLRGYEDVSEDLYIVARARARSAYRKAGRAWIRPLESRAES
ncbi:HEPN domain-containing protein [Thermofilum pendens]|uniref:HEPN domain protein n=1 Tax=Thermofilum pendens (strain DSM 2475 / Hrk 5) TaxID=368408 RepID=A1S0H2_THEPD|nr:HEPN domain-containing protein [Thermofilum pendens]ABL78952.1 HEPN domain protein [Thermofilum pendens Hrk 5]